MDGAPVAAEQLHDPRLVWGDGGSAQGAEQAADHHDEPECQLHAAGQEAEPAYQAGAVVQKGDAVDDERDARDHYRQEQEQQRQAGARAQVLLGYGRSYGFDVGHGASNEL